MNAREDDVQICLVAAGNARQLAGAGCAEAPMVSGSHPFNQISPREACIGVVVSSRPRHP